MALSNQVLEVQKGIDGTLAGFLIKLSVLVDPDPIPCYDISGRELKVMEAIQRIPRIVGS